MASLLHPLHPHFKSMSYHRVHTPCFFRFSSTNAILMTRGGTSNFEGGGGQMMYLGVQYHCMTPVVMRSDLLSRFTAIFNAGDLWSSYCHPNERDYCSTMADGGACNSISTNKLSRCYGCFHLTLAPISSTRWRPSQHCCFCLTLAPEEHSHLLRVVIWELRYPASHLPP